MTKHDLIDTVYESTPNLSRTEAAELVEQILGTMKESLAQGEEVLISGFGKWSVREKAARIGRNPKTGQATEIAARRVVTFAPSQVLKQEVNK